jgi:hypothetical protein
MSEMSHKIPVALEAQASRELEEGSVLLVDCQTSNYRLLNSAGSFLWKQINGERDVSSLAHLLSQEFDIDDATAFKDTEIFMHEMQDRKIISWQN